MRKQFHWHFEFVLVWKTCQLQRISVLSRFELVLRKNRRQFCVARNNSKIEYIASYWSIIDQILLNNRWLTDRETFSWCVWYFHCTSLNLCSTEKFNNFCLYIIAEIRFMLNKNSWILKICWVWYLLQKFFNLNFVETWLLMIYYYKNSILLFKNW